MADNAHQPVLLAAVLAGLQIKKEGIYVDGTFGRGGHASAVLTQLGPGGRLLAMDKDPEAVRVAHRKFAGDDRFAIEQGSYALLRRVLADRGWLGRVDGVLLDLGVSSPQLDSPERGFSFLADGPLDMRMDPSVGPSAADWLRTAPESEIAWIIKRYGEDRYARRIARAIVAERLVRPIETTRRLADLIAAAVPSREPGKHPATRSFQAIRIHINNELGALESALDAALGCLRAGGRLCVISFHSLEDRMVKRFMRRHAREDEAWRGLPDVPAHARPKLRLLGRAVRPSQEEVRRNPRARSATLRAAERLH